MCGLGGVVVSDRNILAGNISPYIYVFKVTGGGRGEGLAMEEVGEAARHSHFK